jgi:hypothetical protein
VVLIELLGLVDDSFVVYEIIWLFVLCCWTRCEMPMMGVMWNAHDGDDLGMHVLVH